MRKHFRKSIVALLTGTMLLAATPAAAFDQETNDLTNSVPMLFDIIVLRPIGLLMTIGGVALYAFPVAPLTLLTRPTDIAKPLGLLVATPGRFTFVDPIGHHPSGD